MVRFTLRQCTYFRTVAECGGIAQAARVLNISQPSVAQAIQKLEDVTGLILFDRHHARGLTLTLQGRIFLRHVLDLEAQAERVEIQAKALVSETAGELRLGAFQTLAPFFLPTLIGDYQRSFPNVSVFQKEYGLAALGDALRDGEIDLALTYDRGLSLNGMKVVKLTSLQPRVIVSSNHPLAQKDSVRLSDLQGLPYVMFDGPGSRAYFEELLAEAALYPDISYASNSLETVRSAVSEGFGFSFLIMVPKAETTYSGGTVKILTLVEQLRPLSIVLAYHEDRAGKFISRFLTLAQKHFGSLPDEHTE
ncbi:LysR family transcriptional regulator [Ruegeria atlantica]|uniref:LysR family transcriptional regulator n=1 Tax=Ruegeria atlantica TaxID=81569 RepID=UPI00147FE267|nr:LysR family transcriptional regulator [Ruegeria atlantica]